MSHLNSNFGIVAERDNKRVKIFNTETFDTIHTIDNPTLDYIDMVITPDCSRAVITSFSDKTLVQLDLLQEPPSVIDTSVDPIAFEDIDITPNGRFAVAVDGGGTNAIRSYSLENRNIVSSIITAAQAVAVSPNGNGLVLTIDTNAYKIHCFNIDNNGLLTDTGITIDTSGLRPINVTFSPDGKFAFAANRVSNSIAVFDTFNPNNIQLLTTIPTNAEPSTMVVSSDEAKVYVLCQNDVDVFNFTKQSPFLTLITSFSHNGYSPTSSYGIDLMALDNSETKLFICHDDNVVIFSINGDPLSTLPNVVPGNAGIAIRNYAAVIDHIIFTTEVIESGKVIKSSTPIV